MTRCEVMATSLFSCVTIFKGGCGDLSCFSSLLAPPKPVVLLLVWFWPSLLAPTRQWPGKVQGRSLPKEWQLYFRLNFMAPSRRIQFNPLSHFVGTTFWGYKARGGRKRRKSRKRHLLTVLLGLVVVNKVPLEKIL